MSVAGARHRHRGLLPIKSTALLALAANVLNKTRPTWHGVNTPVVHLTMQIVAESG